MAARRVVVFAHEIGTWTVEFEGDSAIIIQAITQSAPDLSLHGHIVEGIKKLANNLHWCSFGHTRREGNKAAHALARRAKHCNDSDIWLETVPPDIRDVTHQDFFNIQ